MPINNEGRLLLSEVLAKQVSTDWPAANTDFDLFVQDLIAAGNVIANGLIIRNIEVSDNILTGNITAGGITANTLVLDILTSNAGIFENLTVTYSISGNTLVLDTLTANIGTFQDLTVNGNLIVGSGGATANATISYDDNSDKITFNKSVDINGNLIVSGDLTIEGTTTTLNTATLTIEDKNIVLANGAVDAATADGAGITIDGAGANITYRESGDKLEINKTLDILGDLNITGNISGNGLVIRGIEVSDAVLSGNIAVEGGISGNAISVNSITSNIWNNLYTANVIETAGNLYFTVQRARDSFTAGQNITIIDGEISAESQFLTVANDSRTVTAASGNLIYNLGRSVADSKNILVIVEGLIQIPQTDYTVNNNELVFIDQPPPGANIEVRFFGVEGSSGTSPTLIAVVNSFVGTGNVEYALTQTPPGKAYVTVIVDGVAQQSESYSLVGSILTFSEAPVLGANIDVRILTGQVGAPFITRNYVGDNSTVQYPISSNFTQDQILVFENGVAQVPGPDYTVVSGNVVFTTPPAANINIQIRELSSSGSNALVSIRGLDQITGNLVPEIDGISSLGSPDKRYKSLYLTGNTIVLGDIALSSANGLLQISPVVGGNVVTANAAPSSFTAGDNISIAANGRISSTITAGDNISIAANGRISSTITAGDGINIEANGRVSTSFASVDQDDVTITGTIKASLPFFINPTTIDQDYTLAANTNAMSAGPITIANNVNVTIGLNSEWTIV